MVRYFPSSLLLAALLFLAMACTNDDAQTNGLLDEDGDVADADTMEQEGAQAGEDGDEEAGETHEMSELEAGIEYRFHEYLPIPDEGSLADPSVIKVDGRWYLYATHSQEGFEVWYSDDLANWEHGGLIFEPSYEWQTLGNYCGMWAPHVEYTGERYYLYYTANCRIGVAKSDSPLGPFEEIYDHPLIGNGYGGVGDGVLQGDIMLDFDDLAIDAFMLKTSDGRLILYYTGITPLSTIFAVEMSDYETVSGENVQLLEPETNGWEGLVREGVWVIERDDTFHLMYSGNRYNTINYAIGVAMADSPMGAFVRDERNPLMKTNMDTGIYSPGHHSVAEGAFGDLLIFYHTKLEAEDGDPRRVRYGPLWFQEGKIMLEQP